MRKIKFRGKDIKGNWRYGDLMTIEHFVANSKEKYQIGDFESSLVYDIDKETIGQFTGLHDKNGKEIYEGDIVKVEHSEYSDELKKDMFNRNYTELIVNKYFRNYSVEIANTYCSCGVRVKNKSIHFYLSQSVINNHNVEVIGNIYENKELLNT